MIVVHRVFMLDWLQPFSKELVVLVLVTWCLSFASFDHINIQHVQTISLCLLHCSLNKWNWLSNQFAFLMFVSEGFFLFLGGFLFLFLLVVFPPFLEAVVLLLLVLYILILIHSQKWIVPSYDWSSCLVFPIYLRILDFCLEDILTFFLFYFVSFLLRFSSFIFVVDELFFFSWSWFIHGWFVFWSKFFLICVR